MRDDCERAVCGYGGIAKLMDIIGGALWKTLAVGGIMQNFSQVGAETSLLQVSGPAFLTDPNVGARIEMEHLRMLLGSFQL